MLGPEFPEVLAAEQAGDEAAFARIWRETQPMLLRYLRVLAAGLSEDIASTAWLEVIGSLGDFEGTENGFRSWLITIARNKFRDDRRRAVRRPEMAVETFEGIEPGVADAADESAEAALRLIAQLPSEVAEMVALRVIAGLDVAEVAEITGRSPGVVRVAVHRGLRRLAAALSESDVTAALLRTFR